LTWFTAQVEGRFNHDRDKGTITEW
jgi:hypothetical protein